MVARRSEPSPEGETVLHSPASPVGVGARPQETFPVASAATLAGPGSCPVIPGYEILGELGRGTMGVVYKARHLRLNRLVALKVILEGRHARPEDLLRFLSEAEVLARCRHPHVVVIYEVGWHDGRPYLTAELVEGGTLARKCGRPQPPRWAAELLEAVARAVHQAHRRGVIHRDLKPANVLLTRGRRPKLTDFGLAKRLTGDTGLTETGALLGTPNYMAPEQALCQDVGAAADVYALGAILYELLTGEPPFRAASMLLALERIVSEPPRPPRRLCPSVPRDLEAICLKCLEKEPRDRYGSAAELAADLRRFLAGEPTKARPPSAGRRAGAWLRRRPAVLGGLGGAAVGVAASLLWAPGGAAGGSLVLVLGTLGTAVWHLMRLTQLERRQSALRNGRSSDA
jgi:serine/threonine-protein kinase